jgi:hypothetical protein
MNLKKSSNLPSWDACNLTPEFISGQAENPFILTPGVVYQLFSWVAFVMKVTFKLRLEGEEIFQWILEV